MDVGMDQPANRNLGLFDVKLTGNALLVELQAHGAR